MYLNKSALFAACLCSAITLTTAADLPKDGKYDANLCFGGPLPAIAHSDKLIAGVLDLYGPMVSNLPGGGLYHLNGIRCTGVWAVIDGVYQENG